MGAGGGGYEHPHVDLHCIWSCKLRIVEICSTEKGTDNMSKEHCLCLYCKEKQAQLRRLYQLHVLSFKSTNFSSFALSSSSPATIPSFSTIPHCMCKFNDFDYQSLSMMRHFPMLMGQFHQRSVHQNSFGLIKSDTKRGEHVVPTYC